MRFSTDSLLLACFAAEAMNAAARRRKSHIRRDAFLPDADCRTAVVDIGCGCGAATVALLKLAPSVKVFGMDVSKELVESARRNAVSFGVGDRADFLVADAKDAGDGAPFCDAAMLNPPYWEEKAGRPSGRELNELARRGSGGTAPFLRAAARMLASKGSLFLVYPATRLVSLFGELAGESFGVRRVRLVRPFADAVATRALVEARLVAAHDVAFEPDLVTHRRTPEGGSVPAEGALAFCKWIR